MLRRSLVRSASDEWRLAREQWPTPRGGERERAIDPELFTHIVCDCMTYDLRPHGSREGAQRDTGHASDAQLSVLECLHFARFDDKTAKQCRESVKLRGRWVSFGSVSVVGNARRRWRVSARLFRLVSAPTGRKSESLKTAAAVGTYRHRVELRKIQHPRRRTPDERRGDQGELRQSRPAYAR